MTGCDARRCGCSSPPAPGHRAAGAELSSLPKECLGRCVPWSDSAQGWPRAVCPRAGLVHSHGGACSGSSQRTPPCLPAPQRLRRWSGAGQACSASPAAQGAQRGRDPPSPWQSRRVLGRRGAILKSTAEPAPCPTSARVQATGKQPRAQTQPLAASIFHGSIFTAVPRSRFHRYLPRAGEGLGAATASHGSPRTTQPRWRVSQRGKENKVRMSPPQSGEEKSFQQNTLLIPRRAQPALESPAPQIPIQTGNFPPTSKQSNVVLQGQTQRPCPAHLPARLLVLESGGDHEQVTTQDPKVPCSPPCPFNPSCFPGTLCTVGCRGPRGLSMGWWP